MDCTCHSYHRTQLPIPDRAGNTANRGYSCHWPCINGHYSAYPFPEKLHLDMSRTWRKVNTGLRLGIADLFSTNDYVPRVNCGTRHTDNPK